MPEVKGREGEGRDAERPIAQLPSDEGQILIEERGPEGLLNRKARTLTLLVHGTGAAHDGDQGHRWWQSGSEFARRLGEDLGPANVVQPADRVFHWSGRNSERDRRSAGRRLYEVLVDLETGGALYNLVGHSHGGSVIWHALREAVRRGRSLESLRMWLTLGTPFLEFRPSPLLVLWILPAVLAVSLGVVFATSSSGLQKIQLLIEDGVGQVDLITYVVLTLTAVVCVWALALLLRTIVTVLRARRTTAEERRVESTYGDRWLGIASPDDEAVNGLRVLAAGHRTFRLKQRRIARSERPSILAPWSKAKALLFDAVLGSLLSRLGHGADLPGFAVRSVGPSPTERMALRQAPPDVWRDVLSDAASGVAASSVAFRGILGASATEASDISALLERIQSTGDMSVALVHTRYHSVRSAQHAIRDALRGQEVPRLIPGGTVHTRIPFGLLTGLAATALTAVLALLFLTVTARLRALPDPESDAWQARLIDGYLAQGLRGRPSSLSAVRPSLRYLVGTGRSQEALNALAGFVRSASLPADSREVGDEIARLLISRREYTSALEALSTTSGSARVYGELSYATAHCASHVARIALLRAIQTDFREAPDGIAPLRGDWARAWRESSDVGVRAAEWGLQHDLMTWIRRSPSWALEDTLSWVRRAKTREAAEAGENRSYASDGYWDAFVDSFISLVKSDEWHQAFEWLRRDVYGREELGGWGSWHQALEIVAERAESLAHEPSVWELNLYVDNEAADLVARRLAPLPFEDAVRLLSDLVLSWKPEAVETRLPRLALAVSLRPAGVPVPDALEQAIQSASVSSRAAPRLRELFKGWQPRPPSPVVPPPVVVPVDEALEPEFDAKAPDGHASGAERTVTLLIRGDYEAAFEQTGAKSRRAGLLTLLVIANERKLQTPVLQRLLALLSQADLAECLAGAICEMDVPVREVLEAECSVVELILPRVARSCIEDYVRKTRPGILALAILGRLRSPYEEMGRLSDWNAIVAATLGTPEHSPAYVSERPIEEAALVRTVLFGLPESRAMGPRDEALEDLRDAILEVLARGAGEALLAGTLWLNSHGAEGIPSPDMALGTLAARETSIETRRLIVERIVSGGLESAAAGNVAPDVLLGTLIRCLRSARAGRIEVADLVRGLTQLAQSDQPLRREQIAECLALGEGLRSARLTLLDMGSEAECAFALGAVLEEWSQGKPFPAR